MLETNNYISVFLGYIKPYIKGYKVIILCLLLNMILSLIWPILNRNIIDEGIILQNYRTIVIYSILIFLLSVFTQGLAYLQFLITTKINNKLMYFLSYKAYKHLMQMNMSDVTEGNFNQIIREIDFNINNITKLTDGFLIEPLIGSLRIIGGLIGLFLLNYKLAIVLLCSVPFKIILVRAFAKLKKAHTEKWIKWERELGFWYGDTFTGLTEIKLWSIHRNKLVEFKNIHKNLFKSRFKITNLSQINSIYESLLESFVLNILIFLIGSRMIIGSDLTIGALFSFITYSTFILTPISSLMNIRLELASIKPSIIGYVNFLQTETERSDWNNGLVENRDIDSIEFNNVEMALGGNVILKNISFNIKKGQIIGIVGENGSGKTTILNLLLRLYKPTAGTITINGQDISKIDIENYRSYFSYMEQKPYLFNTTIEKNIKMYKQYSDADMYTATRNVGADEFISRLPEKLQTRVGYDGAKLSGGEKQKIAVARVLLKKGRVLILDEATSNFDHKSEVKLNKFIKVSHGFDIIIVTSHRPEILKITDKIIYIDHGLLKGFDTYDNLLNDDETFINFVEKERSRLNAGSV